MVLVRIVAHTRVVKSCDACYNTDGTEAQSLIDASSRMTLPPHTESEVHVSKMHLAHIVKSCRCNQCRNGSGADAAAQPHMSGATHALQYVGRSLDIGEQAV